MDRLTKHLRRLLCLVAVLPLMLILASPAALAQEQGAEGWSALCDIRQEVVGFNDETWRFF
jgi:hypothetical protein